MTVKVKNIIPRKQAETAQTTQYTAVNCQCIIDKLTATNTTGAAIVISVALVPLAGTAAATNTVSYQKSVAIGEAYPFPEIVGQVLETGGFISTLASAAGLTISASGREVT
jgi:hypothetical protein